MFGYIGALIAVGILLIGASYIPIQLDRKGKFYLIGASALIALATYASKVTFAWWQSSLILVLLAFLTALLLHRRLQQFVLVRDTSVSDEAVHKEEEDIEPVAHGEKEMDGEKEDHIVSQSVEVDDRSDDSKEEEILLQEELSDVAPDASDEEEPAELDVIIEEEPLSTDEPVVSPEEELLAARSDWMEEDETEEEHILEDSFEDRSSILEVIDEGYSDEREEENVVVDSAPEWVDEEDVLEPLEELDEEEEVALREEVLEHLEPLDDEDFEQEDEVEELEGNESAFEMVEWVEGEPDALEDEVPLERAPSEEIAKPLKSVFQTQMLHSLVEEVMIQEEILSSDDYVQYVKKFLQPSLPDQDYYTFASLLLQHHIEHQHYQKLNEWTYELLDKFSDYPMIVAELEYIQDFAKENLDS